MGCAAATAAHPSGRTPVLVPSQHRPAQPSGQHGGGGTAQQQQHNSHPQANHHQQQQQQQQQQQNHHQQQQQQQQQQQAETTMRLAPLVKSLVSIHRQRCTVESDSNGISLKIGLMASAPGEAIVYFQATDVSDSDMGEVTTAKQTQRQRFNVSKEQELRFLLSSESMEKALEGFSEGSGNYALLIDLKVDSAPSDCISLQRSELKLPHSEGDHMVHVGKQWVQCGTYIRTLDALYGTLPNPKGQAEGTTSGDGEGGDCVICLSKPRDVAILHCRHVCLCTSCAKELPPPGASSVQCAEGELQQWLGWMSLGAKVKFDAGFPLTL
eukprot:CAMPEP_0206622486 /NCGR_PEP_ID=MMETSP0325_2-20121206/62833_1 /ASSEMBLY_ACC=CAM_ASM_000347 /TAXON_ID=2866 /ORGANISM="Crypthecodinium cohnii, Strain Seligo" /LENGTH=324 /DNA_ID=CAMNT_0054145817 /DNA_START=307 /DNA_END=1279 /DNA_ORIENTATION=+